MLLTILVSLIAAFFMSTLDLGTTLRERACNYEVLIPLTLFTLNGYLIIVMCKAHEVYNNKHSTLLSKGRVSVLVLIPLIILAVSLPGSMGCKSSQTIARWDYLGEALTGIGGVSLSVFAASLIGVFLAQTLQVNQIKDIDTSGNDNQSIVDQVISMADSLDDQDQLKRYRGIDS